MTLGVMMRIRGEIASMAMAAGLLAGCTSGSEASQELTPTTAPVETITSVETTSIIIPETTTVEFLDEGELVDQYLISPERTEKLDAAIQDIGNRVVDLAESGKIGYFDAFHPIAETYRSQSVDEGWVWLQHVERYGGSGPGSEDQFSVTVWQNADGTFDRSRGILDVTIIDRERGTDDFTSWTEISTAGAFSISSQGEEPRDLDTYETTLGSEERGTNDTVLLEHADRFSDITLEQAAEIDEQAIETLYAYFDNK